MNAIKIAELAGVSKSTVYRALNGEKIKDSTKKRIMAVMKEYNLSDSFPGIEFSPQSVRLIALVTDKYERSSLANVIEIIKNKFVSNGFTVIDVAAENIVANNNEANRLVSGVNFHGYVFIGGDVCNKCSELIKAASVKKPVILVHAYIEGKNIYNITTESETVTTSAISDLINKFRHKKILYCVSDRYLNTQHSKALKGYFENTVKRSGHDDIDCSFIRSGSTIHDTTEIFANYLRHDSSLTAIVAQDEVTAECAYRAAEQLGLHVPEDISIIGYQDTDTASSILREISCINSKSETVADTTLMLMVAALNGRNIPHSIKIPCTYSERHSTAVARSRKSSSYISTAVIGNFVSA